MLRPLRDIRKSGGRLANVKLTSYEQFGAPASFLDYTRTRLYPIVVHGTTFSREPAAWSTRTPKGDYPFCEKLSRQLGTLGIPFPVWANCNELDMQEFKWSGLNEHNARLRAGNELAIYINECHNKCITKFRERPAFVLIGHSHGGNVILASLGSLQPDIALASIHLMGTPFLRYSEKPRWRRTIHDYHNLYTSSEIKCPIHLYTEEIGENIDEVVGLFSFLQVNRYFQRPIRAVVERLAARPQRPVLETHRVVHIALRMLPPANSIANLIYAKFEGSYPTRFQRFKGNIAYGVASLSWPLRWFLVKVAARILAKTFARKLFHFVTGLDPVFFSPEKTIVSAALGFQPLFAYTACSVPLIEAERAGLDLGIDDFLRAELYIRELIQADDGIYDSVKADLEWASVNMVASADIVRKFKSFIESVILSTRSIQMMHTAYYRSDFVIYEIAKNIKFYLPLTFPKVISS